MYKTSMPKESITFVENKENIEDIKRDFNLLRLEYKDLKRRHEELKKKYIKQNNELIEYIKKEGILNKRRK